MPAGTKYFITRSGILLMYSAGGLVGLIPLFFMFPGAGSGEKKDAPRNKSKEKKSNEEDAEEEDKRSALFSHKKEVEQEEEKDEGETKRGNKESLKRWTKRGKALSLTKKAVGKEAQQLNSQQEVPHHSKEFTEEEEEEKKKRGMQRSLEEKELQMIARRLPEEKRGSEEEGSASRKSEVCCPSLYLPTSCNFVQQLRITKKISLLAFLLRVQ